MKRSILWSVVGLTVAWFHSAPAAVQEAWTARYEGPFGRGYAKYIIVDVAGNVYVSGLSPGTNFWPDFATVKYAADGHELWSARYDGPAHQYDEPFGMAVDSSGNVYVTGFAQTSSIDAAGVTIKYDPKGNQVWAVLYNGPGNGHDQLNAISVDGRGNVYVSGSSVGAGSAEDFVAIKYDSGGSPLWVARYNGPGDSVDGAAAQAIDSAGNVYLTGPSGTDLATVKFDADGHLGWVARFVPLTGGNNVAAGIGLDFFGNVYVTGSTPGTNGYLDYLTVKYGPSGNQMWFRLYDGPSHGTDQVRAMAVDIYGGVYITGVSHGPVPGNPSLIGFDYATLRYDAEGYSHWLARYNGGGESFAQSIAHDGAGNAYVTGISRTAEINMATIKYSPYGSQVWEARHSPGIGNAVALDNTGHAHVAGTGADGMGNGFLTIKYLEINSPPRADASATVSLAIATNGDCGRVLLDGSRSSDPDGNPLDFSWSEGGIRIASEMRKPHDFKIGRHTVVLTVHDGTTSDSDVITIIILTPCEAVEAIVEFLEHGAFGESRRSLLTSLEHACRSFEDGDLAAGAKDLQAFQNKIRAQVMRHDPSLAAELILQAQMVIDAVTD